MKSKSSYQYLKWVSLILLALFIGLYLNKNYTDEKKAKQKEIGYLFVNAVKNLEGSLLNEIVFRSNVQRKTIKRDSMKVMTFIGHGDDRNNGNNVEFKIESNDDVRLNEVHGAISMILDVRGDSIPDDLCIDTFPKKVILKEDIDAKFKENLIKANIDINYRIEKSNKNELNKDQSKKEYAASYLDIVSGDKYEVEVLSYKGALWASLIPELLFGLLVFFMIWMSFYLTQKSLKNEQKLISVKNDFIQNMTHELKTPIATASVALEALTEFNALQDEFKRDEYLGVTKQELKRLAGIVDRVLSVQSMDKKDIPVHLEMMNVLEVLEEVLMPMQLQFDRNNIQIIQNIHIGQGIIYSDRALLKGILFNLLDNACKYNNNIKPIIEIHITEDHSNHLKIEITDNGAGIEKEHHKKIFQKFYRVPQGNVHNVKGHGLGLSFVYDALFILKGTVQIISDEIQGTTFEVILPKNLSL